MKTTSPDQGGFGQSLLRWIDILLGAKVMGFLAIAAFGMAAQELLFGTSHELHVVIRFCQIAVFFLFLAEYVHGACRAGNLWKFVLSSSRLFDLVILVAVSASFLPQIEDRYVNAQALQLLRLAPVLFFGYFGTMEISRQMSAPEEKEEASGSEFFSIDPDQPDQPKKAISQEELLSWLCHSKRQGFRICRGQITQELAKALSRSSVPSSLLANALSESSFPRSIHVEDLFLFSGAVPYVMNQGSQVPKVARTYFVAVFTTESILLVKKDQHPMAEELSLTISQLADFPKIPSGFRALAALFKMVNDHYELAASELEQSLRSIEQSPLKKRDRDVYQDMYLLRRVLASLKSDMWRISHLLQAINDKRRTTVFDITEKKDFFALLAHSADFLYETFEQLEDSASALLDLRINMVSFQMNRFMGLLAIATAVGLIPTTMSGFLGMNVEGTNFPISLGDVAFIAAMLVALAIYILGAFGWLKFR